MFGPLTVAVTVAFTAGILLARWLGRLAADRLASRGPELLFLIIGATVTSWLLALYLPHVWAWGTVAVMILIGVVLYCQAIRFYSGRARRNRRTPSPAPGG